MVRTFILATIHTLATITHAQDFVTYKLTNENDTVTHEIQSNSGLAVICTYYQPVKFQVLGQHAGHTYGRFITDGAPLTYPESAFAGPYWPSAILRDDVWEFWYEQGKGTDTGRAVLPAEPYAPFPSSYWTTFRQHLLVNMSSLPQTGLSAGRHEKSNPGLPILAPVGESWSPLAHDFSNKYIQRLFVRDKNAASHTKGYYRQQSEGEWVFVSFASTDIPFDPQASFKLYEFEVMQDPFKAFGDGGGGSIDLSGVINAITQQTTMQEGYFNTFQNFLSLIWEDTTQIADMSNEFLAQLTGGEFGPTWRQLDINRNTTLSTISETLINANTQRASLIGSTNSLLNTANQQRTSMVNALNNILTQISPQFPPSFSSPTPIVTDPTPDPYTTLDIEDADIGINLPPGPSGEAATSWQFTLDLTPLNALGGTNMSSIDYNIDFTPYQTIATIIKIAMVILATVYMGFAIFAEFERK